jgi:hypothetical protein
LLVFAAVCGCATSRPTSLPVAQVAEPLPAVQVLRENVSATDCPDPGSMYGDFSIAIAQAIAAVEGANALINVRFDSRDSLGHYCLRVTGDAVAL